MKKRSGNVFKKVISLSDDIPTELRIVNKEFNSIFRLSKRSVNFATFFSYLDKFKSKKQKLTQKDLSEVCRPFFLLSQNLEYQEKQGKILEKKFPQWVGHGYELTDKQRGKFRKILQSTKLLEKKIGRNDLHVSGGFTLKIDEKIKVYCKFSQEMCQYGCDDTHLRVEIEGENYYLFQNESSIESMWDGALCELENGSTRLEIPGSKMRTILGVLDETEELFWDFFLYVLPPVFRFYTIKEEYTGWYTGYNKSEKKKKKKKNKELRTQEY